MKIFKSILFLTVVLSTLFLACKKDDDEEVQECYRCTHPFNPQVFIVCDSLLTYEACVLGPHEQSLQMIIEITEFCNGQVVRTMEDIDFIENFLAEQQNAGAQCETF